MRPGGSTTTQADALHAMPALHARPQLPQLAASLASAASQPLAGSASQSAKPTLHAKPQAPAAQVDLALARAGHTVVQAPQWAGSALTLTSHPFTGFASQSRKPSAHRVVHEPPTQPATAFAPA